MSGSTVGASSFEPATRTGLPAIALVTDDFQEYGRVFVYRQVVGYTRHRPVVVTWRRLNADVFPYDPVVVLESSTRLAGLANRIAGKLGRAASEPALESRGRYRRMLHRYAPRLIHVHTGWVAARLLAQYGPPPVPLLVTFHGSDINAALADEAYYRALVEQVFPRSARCIFVSESLRGHAIDLGCPPEKAVVCYLGVPASPPVERRGRTGRRLLVCVARFAPVKGHQYLIEAFSLVAREDSDVDLALVGDGPLRGRVRWLVERLGLQGRVRLMGALQPAEVAQVLAAADIYVQHSVTTEDGQQEALGIAIGEAMSAGLPVVATRSGGTEELVTEGLTGMLVPERDVAGMAAAIQRLLGSESLRGEMGARAREYAESYLVPARCMLRLEALYDQVLEAPPAAGPPRTPV